MGVVRLGVLGCAEIARRRMLPAFSRTPGAVVTAVASRDAAKAEKVAAEFGGDPVTGYAALLERDDVDAVYVPLPAAMHESWVEAALRAGKHVLAEKPVTLDPAATARLAELARAHHLVLMENVMFVHHRQHATVAELVRDGAIGELRGFEATFTIPPLADDDIRYRADLGGGALSDVGVYPVRAALHLLGDDLTVCGAVLAAGAGRRVDTRGAALLRTGAGVVATLVFGMEHSYRSSYTLTGSAGRITLDRAFTPPADHQPVLHLDRNGRVEQRRLDPDDQVANTVAAFVAAVSAGGPTALDASLAQIRLLDDIRRKAS
ncbi:Gfo/Idh/MocA family protein [Krasilnikovia sp. MM14-A1004]|uniref:Gfo/Idh/MocA family protein n=1 Tax=Krasilnikovia sp. MM14-A1004 TaxID=3373541 RepID=UPI00399CDAD7